MVDDRLLFDTGRSDALHRMVLRQAWESRSLLVADPLEVLLRALATPTL